MAVRAKFLAQACMAAALCSILSACQTMGDHSEARLASEAQQLRETGVIRNLEAGLPLDVEKFASHAGKTGNMFKEFQKNWTGEFCNNVDRQIIFVIDEEQNHDIEQYCSFNGFESFVAITNMKIERKKIRNFRDIDRFTFSGIRHASPEHQMLFGNSLRKSVADLQMLYSPEIVSNVTNFQFEIWGRGAGFVSAFDAEIKEQTSVHTLPVTCNQIVGSISSSGQRVLNSFSQTHFSAMACSVRDDPAMPTATLEESWDLLERVRLGGKDYSERVIAIIVPVITAASRSPVSPSA